MNNPTFRWLAVVVGCCGLAAILILPTPIEQERCPLGVCGNGAYQGVRMQVAASRAHARALSVALGEVDDLALAARVVPRDANSATGEPFVWFAPEIPEPVRRSVREVLAAERDARRPWAGRGRVAVLVTTDTARTIQGARRSYATGSISDTRAILPSPYTSGRCVAVIHLRSRELKLGVRVEPGEPLMDACGFYDAFGAPGRAIAAALDSGRYDAARRYAPALPDSMRRRGRNRSLVGVATVRANAAAACAAGTDAACEAMVAARLAADFRTSVSTRPAMPPLPLTPSSHDRAEGSSAMDDIAADLGPERFARVWTSDEPLVEAYREVAGRSVADVARPAAAGLFEQRGRRTGLGSRTTTDRAHTIGTAVLASFTIAALAVLAVLAAPRPRPA